MARGFHTIHNRLFLLFLFGMLSLVLIVSGLYYMRATEQVQAKISDIARKNVSQTVGLFDLLLKGYDSMSKSISGNFDLQRLLADNGPKNSAVKYINERTITNTLGAIYYSREDLIGIHVISYSGAIYSYGNKFNAIDPEYMKSAWFEELRESTGEMKWLGVYPRSVIDQLESRPVFAFGRQLYDLSEHRPIGIVLIESNPKPIVSALSNLSLGPHSEVYIVSPEGRVIASADSDVEAAPELPASLNDIPRPSYEGDVVVDQRPGRLAVAARPEMADWSVVSVTPDKDLNVELNQTKQFLLIVVSALIVVATALATAISRSISSPLKRLIYEMKQVEQGNFRGLLHVKSYEEINILVASFNHMVRRMDDLIERVKLSSISEKNAQLQALQSQVNPHFLYNTLDMIYWMLDEKENDRLGKVVLSLSHMFRYSSNWEEESVVTLREEREQMKHYLTIIGIRLDGRLQIDIDIEERFLDFRLPKMTLQPIIENAVKHGLERLDRPGCLRVYAQTTEKELQLVVADNGNGLEPDVLVRLTAFLQSEGREALQEKEESADVIRAVPFAKPKPRRGIGLANVHRRLMLMFGGAYGIKVSSEPGRGTTVIVTMPYSDQSPLPAAEGGQR